MQEILNLPIDKIVPNPYQPRKVFDVQALRELSDSIKQYGVMQPINVRFINNSSYELVAGERRLRAAKLAGLTVIPSIVVNISDQDSAVIAIIENLQRQDLNFLEEAEGFFNLLHDHSFTQEQLAEKLGKSQSAVANKLRILRLPREIKKRLIENKLTERHARALLRINNEELLTKVFDTIVERELNVKGSEELIDKVLEYGVDALNPPVVEETPEKEKKPKTKKNNPKIKHFVKDIRLFTNTVKSAVDIMKNSGIETDYICDEVEDGLLIKIHIKQ